MVWQNLATSGHYPRGMDERVLELVLRAVEQVPPGRVVSYGDLAWIIGIGPRQVGAAMREAGASVSWWRVTNHQGELPAHLLPEARRLWHQEGIPLRANGRGCDIRGHRADLGKLADDFLLATADLVDADKENP